MTFEGRIVLVSLGLLGSQLMGHLGSNWSTGFAEVDPCTVGHDVQPGVASK